MGAVDLRLSYEGEFNSDVDQPQRQLQDRPAARRTCGTSAAAASAAASAATSGDADLPGRLGDPGDGHLSAAAASAAAAAAGAGTRVTQIPGALR